MDRLMFILNNKRGVSVLPFIFILSIVLFIGQQFVMMDQQTTYKNLLSSQNLEAQKTLLAYLEEIVSNELALRNSRFSTNSELYRCLMGTPTPCDETLEYDMILYSPNPPVLFAGGTWPTPPAGISMIAGGLAANKIVYTRAGGFCGSTFGEPNNGCPLQAIIQFKPLCGGTPAAPTLRSTPGICTGPATGFDIMIGVGVLKNGEMLYRKDSSNYGDMKIFTIKAISLIN